MGYSISTTGVFRPGDKIQSRYRILNQLGTGGFGHTYLAEDTNRFNEKCVLKVFTPQLSEKFTLDKAREMFEREAETLYRLEHPQIPKFHQILRHGSHSSGCLLLVQDYIKGESYNQLLNQRFKKGRKFNEQEIELLLLNVLPILEYIHSHGIIHRDISPENLILDIKRQLPILIDFGCIKEIEQQAQLRLAESEFSNSYPVVGTAIGKAYYAPPEQIIKGVVYPHTDLYALAAMAVVLLTGKKPQELRNSVDLQWNWQPFANVNPQFANILSKMLESDPNKRFNDATEVRKNLQEYSRHGKSQITRYNANLVKFSEKNQFNPKLIKSFFTKKYLQFIIPVILLLFFGKLISNQTTHFNKSLATLNFIDGESTQIPENLQENFSTGERLLVNKLITPDKEKAASVYAQGNFKEAVSFLSSSLKVQPNDPEALIYLNNSLIGQIDSYDIAVSVPITTNVSSALEVLRGVAHAQDKINKKGGINGFPIKIQIVNDENNPTLAKKIATSLSKDQQILGVVGHYSSEVTLATAEIYHTGNLVAISPTSSSVKLSNVNPYIFRTVSNDFIAARALAQYAIEEKNDQSVAIFYNSQSEHSKSLKSELKSAIILMGGTVVNTFDLSDPDFNPVKSFQQAVSSGADALMLSPDSKQLDKALQVIQINRQRLSLYGGSEVYTSKSIQLVGENAQGMVLEIPWHIKSNLNSDFVKESSQLWNADVSWRTAMAYDAIQSLINAMIVNSSKVTRTNIQKALSDPSFAASGAGEKVRFLPSGNRANDIQLVEIKASKNRKDKYEYVPFDPE